MCVLEPFTNFSQQAPAIAFNCSFVTGAVSFGGEILKAFSGQDSASGRAACVSAFILEDNEAVKKQLMGLTVNLAPSAANPPTSLLAHCITALSNHIYTPGLLHSSAPHTISQLD